MKRRLLILAVVSLLWGSEWLLAETTISIPRFRLLACRSLTAGLFLIPLVIRNRQTTSGLAVYKSVLLGIVVIALPTLLLAMRTDLSPGLIVVLFATIPLIVSVLEEGTGLRNSVALIGGLGGTAFLVRGGLSFSLSQTGSVLFLLASLIVVSAIFVRAKLWLSIAAIPASVMVQMFTTATIFGLCSLVWEGPSLLHPASMQWSNVWNAPDFSATIALGIFGGAIAYSGFYWLLLNANPSQAATVQWLVPVVGVGETAVWLRHLPPWDSAFGGIVAVASTLFMFSNSRQDDGPLTLEITSLPQHENASLRSPSR